MPRALASALLAAVLILVGAASVRHLPAHAAATDAHPPAQDEVSSGSGRHADLRDRCDAPGGKTGGACLADAVPARGPLQGPGRSRAVRAVAEASPPHLGRPTAVPTGPPKA